MPSVPADVLADLGGVFDSLEVGWYVFGAQAAAMHGAPRLTIDVDVTVALGDLPTRALVEALGARGFALRVDDDDFVRRTRVLPAVHSSSGIPVDIVLAGPGIEELFLERAQIRTIGAVRVPVACPEDIVAMKVLAGRAKDLEDVTAILRARAKTFRYELARETLGLLEQALDRRDLLTSLERAEHQAGVAVSTAIKRSKKKRRPASGSASRPAPRKRSKKSRP